MARKENSSTTASTDNQSNENNSSKPVSQNTSGVSLFSESNKARFSRLPTDQGKGAVAVVKKAESTAQVPKKVVNNHEFDAFTVFVGNLPSSSMSRYVIL